MIQVREIRRIIQQKKSASEEMTQYSSQRTKIAAQ